MPRPRGRPKGSKTAATQELIEACIEICDEASPITVRGICYKLFTRGFIPDMSKTSTDRVGKHLTNAREDGSLDWRLIVDEQRQVRDYSGWTDPSQFINTVRDNYRKDYWQMQKTTLEVWSEKGTVGGVLEPVLDEFGVGLLVMKGYASFSAIKRACEYRDGITVLYVGDIDPSGMHMSEVDLPQRIEEYGGNITIERIALLKSDVTHFPSFLAATKNKDTRYNWYVANHGTECWELDAMDPNDLRERVSDNIKSFIDWEAWDAARKTEAAEIESINVFSDSWKSANGR